ncbi:MAG TPA: hypothetical protein VMF52_12555 [Steroidobacteraceae bacterium]|nr:hypothetical protein [Steroidobacteraceae bacterium]
MTTEEIAAESRKLCAANGVRHTVDTATFASMIGRSPQTLRRWACYGSGPVSPVRVNGRLRWATDDARKILGVAEAAA